MLLTPSKTPIPKVIVQPASENQDGEPEPERRKTRSSSTRSNTSTSSGNRSSTLSTENAFMQLSTSSGINMVHLDGTNQGQRMQEVGADSTSPKPGYVVKLPSSPAPPSYYECCPPPPSFYSTWPDDGKNQAETIIQGDTNLSIEMQCGTNEDGTQ